MGQDGLQGRRRCLPLTGERVKRGTVKPEELFTLRLDARPQRIGVGQRHVG